jgi:hypothetical protein
LQYANYVSRAYKYNRIIAKGEWLGSKFGLNEGSLKNAKNY